MLYIGVDLGTSSMKVLLVDGEGTVLRSTSQSYPLMMPQPGWSEQDPEEWWSALCVCVPKLLEDVDATQVAGLSFGGQMHGLVALDENDQVIDIQEPRPEWESALAMLWHRWDHRNKQFIGDFCYRTSYLKQVGGFYRLPLAWGSDDITALRAAKELGIANTQAIGFQYRENSHTITSSAANARIKIEALVAQHQWFSAFLNKMASKELSAEDQQLLDTIEAPRHKVIIKALGRYIPDYVKGNPIKLLWCYQKVKHLGIGLDMYVKWYYRSLGL